MLTEHAQLLRSLALSGAGLLRNLNSWSTSASCIVCIAYDFSFVFFSGVMPAVKRRLRRCFSFSLMRSCVLVCKHVLFVRAFKSMVQMKTGPSGINFQPFCLIH